MLLSRGATILRNAYQFNQTKQVGINLKQIRNKWCYRTAREPEKQWLLAAEVGGGVMWWWIFWNAWHEFDHITGHYPDIRPIEWSDEELGIPPIDN